MDINEAIVFLHEWMPFNQWMVFSEACRGEEKSFFEEKAFELVRTIQSIPKLYETDGEGQAVAKLHYFVNSYDCWLTEVGKNGEAFGYCDAGMGFPELGYVNINELKSVNAELDLYFNPTPLEEIMKYG